MNAKTKFLLLLAVAGLVLAGCGDKAAIDRAKADEIRQQAADEAAARRAEEARKQADWEATQEAKSFAQRVFYLLGLVVASVVLAFFLLMLVYRSWQMSRSMVRAWSVYAEERARLAAGTIKVDRETRTWPALVADNAVHNLETGEVYLLGKARRADPQQAAVSGQVRALGVAAQAAERTPALVTAGASVGKSTKDAQAADALPGLGASIPLVSPALACGASVPSGDAGTLIVEQDTSEMVDL